MRRSIFSSLSNYFYCGFQYTSNINKCKIVTIRRTHKIASEDGIIRSEFVPVPIATVPVHDTLLDAIWKHSLRQPGKAAFISAEYPEQQISFAEFLLQCHSVAQFLDSIGVGKGQVGGVVVHNCWQFLAVFLGASMQGGCISGANPQHNEDELACQFNETKCRVAFCSDFLLDKMKIVMQKCSNLKHLVLVPSQYPPIRQNSLPPNIHYWNDIIQKRPNIERRMPEINIEKDFAYLPFSSGTTGPSKGVMLSHRNVGTMLNIFNTHFDERVCHRISFQWDWKREYTLLMLPLYHIYGFLLGLNCLFTGTTGIMMKKFDLDLYCRIIQDYKLKYATLVPPILVLLAKTPKIISRYDLSSLRFIMTGAAPVADEICTELKKLIPSVVQISQGYGMTEQSMCSHLPVFGMDNQKAAGKLNPNFEMKIVDIEKGTTLKIGEVGEICTRSPTVMLGYLNRPDATAETLDEDGWLKTGDIGYHDERGWTYVVDRRKELIKVKGLQVAPAELEGLLLSHPDIRDCAVIGVSDNLCGEVPKAFIVPDSDNLTEENVKIFLKDKVASYKQPKYVEFVEIIPKSPSGKILRRLLQDKK
ncbi:hypothetical protein ACQ4LE_007340 [Meloidogyne hapla]